MADSKIKNKPNTTAVQRLGLLLYERLTAGTDETNPANNTYETDNIFFKDFATAALGSTENRILNGDFIFDQINEGAAYSVLSGGSTPLCDGWRVQPAGTPTSTLTAQRVVDGPLSFYNSLQFVVTSAASPTAAQRYTGRSFIESLEITDLGFGTANAKSVVLSFWAKSSLTGNFGASLHNAVIDRSYVVQYNITVANTWQYFSYVIPGDTTGTWVAGSTASGMALEFALAAGSNFETATGSWQAGYYLDTSGNVKLAANAAATLNIANVRLRAGTFDVGYIPRTYQEVLARVQRYYWKSFPSGTAVAQSAGVAGAISIKNPIALGDPSEDVAFPVTMRATPTITTYNPSAANANWRDITAAADVTVSVDPGSCLGPRGVMIATTAAVTTLGDILAIHVTANARLS